MHLYLRTVGFSEYDTSKEENIISMGIKESLSNNHMIINKKLNRGLILIPSSKRTGIAVYGRFDRKEFVKEYYYPYLLGSKAVEIEEMTVERHIDKESYAVVSEDVRAGITLIFYLQNIMDYLNYRVPDKGRTLKENKKFTLYKRGEFERSPVKGKCVVLSGLSLGGMILFPISKNESQVKKCNDAANLRKKLLADARKGDEDAIENLTIEDLDIYTKLSKRIMVEDVFTIVDSSFMPCGVECDQYSIVGEIKDISIEKNMFTGEEIYILLLECNEMYFDIAINRLDLMGEPAIGRRFRGQIWLQGNVVFGNDKSKNEDK